MIPRSTGARAAEVITLGSAFAERRNVLNAIRLVLASSVIVWHAETVLTGRIHTHHPLAQALGELPVDGFFAISGFLICWSWQRTPRPRAFLLARAARLYPAFWVCLTLTVLVFAPIGYRMASGSWGWSFGPGAAATYLLGNASLVMITNDIGGTPIGVPYPGDWNSSLWTLKWEFSAYVMLMALGLAGWLRLGRTRALTLAAWAVLWVLGLGILAGAPVPGPLLDAVRFAFLFLVGATTCLLADRLRLTWARVLSAITVVLAASLLLPGYALFVGPLLAYALVGASVLIRAPRLELRNDISYGMYIYGFPVEQTLVQVDALRDLGWFWFSAVCVVATAPLATASWFLVERPVQRWARGRRHSSTDAPVAGSVAR